MMITRRKLIRTRANELLLKCAVTQPPVPLGPIAAELGIRVIPKPAADELSGFLLRDRATDTAVIGVNELHPRNRQRFTVAHEIGHFLLHKAEELHVDKTRTGYDVRLRYGEPNPTDIDEREANLFAAELLMPHHFLENDMSAIESATLDAPTLRQLAMKYEVSPRALAVRLAVLGYIAE